MAQGCLLAVASSPAAVTCLSLIVWTLQRLDAGRPLQIEATRPGCGVGLH